MGKYDKRNNFKDRKNYNPLNEIIDAIRGANSLKEVLIPEKYALPGGWAEKTAMELISRGNKGEGMNNHQLRKIFIQVKNIEGKILSDKTKFHSYKNEIFLIMPQVAYALGRKVIPQNFYDLMKECIKPSKIKEAEDFLSFVDYFTSIVAYFKALDALKDR